MARLAACVGTACVMVAGLTVVVPTAMANGSVGAPHARIGIRAQDERFKRKTTTKRQSAGRNAATPPCHLHVVADAQAQESEGVVLRRLLEAMDSALAHPALSTGWHVALTSARKHLAVGAAEPQRE